MKIKEKKSEVKLENRYIKGGLTLFCVGLALIAAYYVIHNTGRIGEGNTDNQWNSKSFLYRDYNGIPALSGLQFCGALQLSPSGDPFKEENTSLSGLAIYRNLHRSEHTAAFYRRFLLPGHSRLVESIISLFGELPSVVNRLNSWFRENIQENPQLLNLLQGRLTTLTSSLQNWMDSVFMPGIQTLISGVSVGIIGTLNGVLDVFIALIICVYILNSKELFQAQVKKIILAVCKPRHAESLFELGSICNETFGGFINGNIIASILVGCICFIVMSIMNLPLATLISVIVGVTNVIPFFGPFIGAIPSALLLFIIEPVDALKFIIMIFILQQVEGNIIAPKILGDTTGLPSFWVIFSIIVGGGLFGLAGMLLGVPLFSIFYIYVTRFVDHRLEKKGLKKKTTAYEELKKYNINKEDIFGKDEEGSGGVPSDGGENFEGENGYSGKADEGEGLTR